MKRILSALLLTSTLALPVVLKADDDDHRRNSQRYYDREHRDYHEWNDREGQAFQRYREEQRLQNLEWQRANRRQQQAYWRWRHNHEDRVLFPEGDRR